MAPPPVRLTDGPVGGPLEGHALLAAEGHDGVQGRPRSLQPPVGQDSRRAAVDLCNDKKEEREAFNPKGDSIYEVRTTRRGGGEGDKHVPNLRTNNIQSGDMGCQQAGYGKTASAVQPIRTVFPYSYILGRNFVDRRTTNLEITWTSHMELPKADV